MSNILTILTCHNRKGKTLKCIESLKKNEAKVAFIVVDDGSTDGTYEELQQLEDIEILSGDGNLYYSGGMRLGINYAKVQDLSKIDYVLFVNDDVEFYDGAIDHLIEYLNGEHSIIVGPTCDTNGVISYGGEVRTGKIKPGFKKVRSLRDKKVYCDTFCANCVLIPKDIFKMLPTIDPAYRHSAGDFDYGFEASRRGIMILASDQFVGLCNDNPVTSSWRDRTVSIKERIRRKESVKGLPFKMYFHFLNKNYGIITALIFSITPYMRILLKR